MSVGVSSEKAFSSKLTPVSSKKPRPLAADRGFRGTALSSVGNKATLFVNGTKIAEFNGKPPEGGGLIGLEDLFGEEGRRNRGEIRELCHRAEVPLRGPIRLGLAPSRQRAS